MSTVRVAVAGATGYAGEELIRILLGHPKVQITGLAASAKWDRPVPLADVYPRFAGRLDLPVTSLDAARLADACDLAFLALPHGVSMGVAAAFLKAGRKVVDLGGDFRLKDRAAFERWYATPHTQPDLLGEAVYGISELAGEAVKRARLVANPGCYATSVILAAAPLIQAGLVEPDSLIIDAKSGITGAGRKAESHLLFGEMNENLYAYKVNHHQHMPEMEQALALLAKGKRVSLVFVPQVVPMSRGILSNLYGRMAKPAAWDEVDAAYRACYRGAPFIRLRAKGQWPRVRDVAETNFCDIGFTVDPEKRLIIVSAAIDNLTKGAAGQAVQNMNLMCGWPETTGLLA